MKKKKISDDLICHSSITGALDMWILKLKRKRGLCKVNFLLQEVSRNGDKVYFSKIVFQLVTFQYLISHLTKIVHSPHYRKLIGRSKC